MGVMYAVLFNEKSAMYSQCASRQPSQPSSSKTEEQLKVLGSKILVEGQMLHLSKWISCQNVLKGMLTQETTHMCNEINIVYYYIRNIH